jgi:hypothetical protein
LLLLGIILFGMLFGIIVNPAPEEEALMMFELVTACNGVAPMVCRRAAGNGVAPIWKSGILKI